MFTSHLAMTMALVLAPPSAAQSASRAIEAEVHDCEISPIEDQGVPASDAGVLIKLKVKPGDHVAEDAELARVDDREAQAALTVKRKDYEVAKQEADSDIEIRYNAAQADVARTAYEKVKAVVDAVKGGVSAIEVLRMKLEWEKSKLGIEQAEQKHISAVLAADAKQAEVDAANVGVTRRVLRAPFTGVVAQVFRHKGEWVSPGDPVMRLVRVDRLRVTGNVDGTKWGPVDIEGRQVTVEVMLPHDRIEKVSGKVVFVSPVIALGQLSVEAEIDAPKVNGRWLELAGLPVKMTIQVAAPEPPRPLAEKGKPTSGKPEAAPTTKVGSTPPKTPSDKAAGTSAAKGGTQITNKPVVGKTDATQKPAADKPTATSTAKDGSGTTTKSGDKTDSGKTDSGKSDAGKTDKSASSTTKSAKPASGKTDSEAPLKSTGVKTGK